jgi:perosamine synthetase
VTARSTSTSGNHVPLSVPEIGGNEWKYVKECLDTNWVSSVGPFVDRFEQMMADYIGTKYAVATVNGTAALHIALLVAGVQPGDEVLVPTLTFIAPVNTIRYCGAWPVFMDAEPTNWQMDPEKCARFLEQECVWREGRLFNKSSHRPVTAILPVDVLGHPCDFDAIRELAQKYGLTIIEDASESLGAKFKGEMVGRIGDVACFSFNGNKTITTGGGGMIVTDNHVWAEKAQYLTTQAKDDPIEYVHNEIGYNYRLTNVLAALGVAQMERLDEYIDKKRAIAARYREALGDLEGISLMGSQAGAEPTFWLYTILMSPGTTLGERKQAIQDLNDNGIGSRPLWHPIHALPPYQNCQSYEIEHASDLYQRAVSVPSSVGLTDADLERSIEVIRSVIIG